jgi:hypothetical protein
MHSGRHMSHMNKRFIHLGVAVPGEASETMVKLYLWPSMVLLCKLAIHCNYIWYILLKTDFYVLGLRKREKMHCLVVWAEPKSVAISYILYIRN